MLLGAVAFAITANAQDSKKGWYLSAGASYFTQTSVTEYPLVSGQQPFTTVYAADGTTVVSKEANHGSFGAGIRTNFSAGYRFTERLGFELGCNYFLGNSNTMVETQHKSVGGPVFVDGTAKGRVRALDLSPRVVLFLGEVKGFETYTKVGVILPVYGNLTIESNKTFYTPVGTLAKTYAKDVIKPNPTIGFMSAVGTSYSLTKKLSAFAELEYRNFTVSGKSKETVIYEENGVDRLNTPTTFRPDASYSAKHTNYVDKLTAQSNSTITNPAGFDNTKATDDLKSFIGISGLGFNIGLKYKL